MAELDLDLIPELRRALVTDAFVVHYQPEVDLVGGDVVGMEALLRWQHPARGLLWPSEFLPVAEAAGLLREIGAWVLDNCLPETAEWNALPMPVSDSEWLVWFNVNWAQLLDPAFPDDLVRRCETAGAPIHRIGLEVTEQSLDRMGERALPVLTRLHDCGVSLAVDDFGMWSSVPALIGELPVDAIKLDRSLVRNIHAPDQEVHAASFIELAHAHGLYVVAEGVESWAEGARLCELGCDRALGYLFSGPQRSERARRMLCRGFAWSPDGSSGRRPAVPLQPWPGS